jgi:hypothetical protein
LVAPFAGIDAVSKSTCGGRAFDTEKFGFS